MKKYFAQVLLCLISAMAGAQENLLDAIDKQDSVQVAEAAFKGLKIVNFESTKLLAKREFYFVVSHRFGSISNGFDDFFGLDFANTRLQILYGVSDGFNISTSRNSFNKTYEISLKYRLLQQQSGMPVTVVGYTQGAINTQLDESLLTIPVDFGDRISVTQQVLISRKFSERLSLELMPTYFYEGYVDYPDQNPSQFALGFGGRYKLGRRWSLNVDYGWHLNRAAGRTAWKPRPTSATDQVNSCGG